MNKTSLYTICFWLILLVAGVNTAKAQSLENLKMQFAHPQDDARPWCFWYWMYGSVSREGITADLEAMKQAGLEGAYLMPIQSMKDGKNLIVGDSPVSVGGSTGNAPIGNAPQLSETWWQMVHHSMQEADRLGLKLGLHICDGFALAGGPWITPKESMQKVVWADTLVAGNTLMKNVRLPHPEAFQGYYEDIRLFALPVRQTEIAHPKSIKMTVGDAGDVDWHTLQSSDFKAQPATDLLLKDGVNVDNKGVIRSSRPCWIQYQYAQPITAHNVEIILSGNNYEAHRLTVMASDDGVNYRFVKQLQPARQGWQNTDMQSTHAIPPTTAKYFRFYWTPAGSEPGTEDMDAAKWKPNLKIKELVLHASPRINQWEGKAGFVWRVASATTDTEVPAADCLLPAVPYGNDGKKVADAWAKGQILDLTHSMKSGILEQVKLPKGTWRLLRMGHTSTGHTNATGGGGKGLECDKFSSDAVKKQFDGWFGEAFRRNPGLAKRVLKVMHVDSWECGSQNWSDNFAAEFQKRRGYDLMPYLPLMAGIPLESAAQSEKTLRDVRTTIAELVPDIFYTTLRVEADSLGCEFSAECVAPTMVSDGLLHYDKVTRPMGEFWYNSPTHDKPNDMLDAVSGSHIYGKNMVQAEGFTELRGTWCETPATVKPLLDRNFALGVNKLVFHVFAHNPWTDRKPGMTLDGIGFYFQRDNTWFKLGAKAFTDYISRCQTLLQYGRPIIDIAVFTGEEIPRRSVLPERLVPSLPGIFGTERVESERKRLANEDQPMRTIDGVVQSANIAYPEDWINPMRGYQYDSFNKDALLRLAEAKDGKILLPGGMSYKVLVLPLPRPMCPDTTLSAESRQKIEELRRSGVIIPQMPYQQDDFSQYGLLRDVEASDGIAWTHRQSESIDIYFVANQKNKTRTETMKFRMTDRTPQIWNPMTGKISSPAVWKNDVTATEVTLHLQPYESVFVIFPREKTQPYLSEILENTGYVKSWEIDKLRGKNSWQITFESLNRTMLSDTLFLWNEQPDEKIRYYSGTAIYKTSFMWKEKTNKNVYLQFSDLHDIAKVRINGVDCGTTWMRPYQLDVTNALKKGKNELEIEVVNTWVNAIQGMDEGKAPYEGIWTNARYRMQKKELLPSGLAGDLTLITKGNKD